MVKHNRDTILSGCQFTPGLKRVYENGDMCKMVIKMEDISCVVDEVEICELGLNNSQLRVQLNSNVEVEWN